MSTINRRQNDRSIDLVIVGLIARLLIAGSGILALMIPGGVRNPEPIVVFVAGIAIYVKVSEIRLQRQIDDLRNQQRPNANSGQM